MQRTFEQLVAENRSVREMVQRARKYRKSYRRVYVGRVVKWFEAWEVVNYTAHVVGTRTYEDKVKFRHDGGGDDLMEWEFRLVVEELKKMAA